MTFAEALIWMNESPENVAVRLPVSTHQARTEYRIKDNVLHYLSHADQSWPVSQMKFNELISAHWEKSEPIPDEVEVAAYVSKTGCTCFVEAGSKDHEYLSSSENWRKVKVKFL